MGKRTTDPDLGAAIDAMHDTIAANVRARMERRFEQSGNKPKALARAAGLGVGTVQRVLAGSAGYANQAPSSPSIATLMRLAWLFEEPLTSFFVPRDTRSVVLGLASPLSQDASAKNSPNETQESHNSLRFRSRTR